MPKSIDALLREYGPGDPAGPGTMTCSKCGKKASALHTGGKKDTGGKKGWEGTCKKCTPEKFTVLPVSNPTIRSKTEESETWTQKQGGSPKRRGKKKKKVSEGFAAMIARNFDGAPVVDYDQHPDTVSERRIDSVTELFLLEDAQMDATSGLTQALKQFAANDERAQQMLYGQTGPLKSPGSPFWDYDQWVRILGRTKYGKSTAIPALKAAATKFKDGARQKLALTSVASYIAQYGLQKQSAQQNQPAQAQAQVPQQQAPSQPQQPQQPRQSIQVPGKGTVYVPVGEDPEAYRKRMGFASRQPAAAPAAAPAQVPA